MNKVFTTVSEKERQIREIEEEIERKKSEISNNEYYLKQRKIKLLCMDYFHLVVFL